MYEKYEEARPCIVNPEIYRAFIEVMPPQYIYFTLEEWLAYKGFEIGYEETKGDE